MMLHNRPERWITLPIKRHRLPLCCWLLRGRPIAVCFRLGFFFLLLNISSFSHNTHCPHHYHHHRSKFTRACYVMDHKRGSADLGWLLKKEKCKQEMCTLAEKTQPSRWWTFITQELDPTSHLQLCPPLKPTPNSDAVCTVNSKVNSVTTLQTLFFWKCVAALMKRPRQ